MTQVFMLKNCNFFGVFAIYIKVLASDEAIFIKKIAWFLVCLFVVNETCGKLMKLNET